MTPLHAETLVVIVLGFLIALAFGVVGAVLIDQALQAATHKASATRRDEPISQGGSDAAREF